MSTTTYLVEAWRGLDCIAFSRVARATTVATRAATYILDRGADRIYVRQATIEQPLASWQATGGWRLSDEAEPALVAAITDGGL